MKKYKKGLTCGVYDMFHIGHLNILKNAKEMCEHLSVCVSTDEVVLSSKNKKPIINENERLEIVSSIKYVDAVFFQTSYEIDFKVDFVAKHDINVLFVGSDWKGTEKWKIIEEKLKLIKCDVVFLPHTDGISSSLLRNKVIKK